MSDKSKTIQVPPELHDELSELQVWLRKTIREELKEVRSVTYSEVILFLLLLNESFRETVEKNPKEVKRVLESFLNRLDNK